LEPDLESTHGAKEDLSAVDSGDPAEQLGVVEKLDSLDDGRVVQDPELVLSHLACRQGTGGAGQYGNDGGGTKPRATQWAIAHEILRSVGQSFQFAQYSAYTIQYSL
jgi:hypothetical protein